MIDAKMLDLKTLKNAIKKIDEQIKKQAVEE